MQEDLENRTVTLVVNSSKFSGRTLFAAMKRFLGFAKHQVQKHHDVKPQGKQSVKKLIGQDAGVSNADLGEKASFREFDQVARKYGVDYAVKRVEKEGKVQHLVFFKARDADAIYSAMTEYTNRWDARHREDRPSIPKLIKALQAMISGKDRQHARDRDISR